MTATTTKETALLLDGLRCSGCAHRVEGELRGLAGVHDASVNYTTYRALVRHEPEVARETLAACVHALGYEAIPYDPETLDRPAARSSRRALVRLLVAGFLAGNVMVIAIALYLGAEQGIEPEIRRALRWLAIALSLPAASYCAWPFWRGALLGLARRELTIDVPIVLGVGTAFVVSVLGTLAETHHIFMDSAAMIVFLILLGRTLERSARARATGAVERLLSHSPRTARRRSGAGIETVDVRELARGDVLVVAPGQAVAADGRIVSGETELDESLLTGEATPVHRRTGEEVAAGTRNLVCEIELEVMAPASEGTVARLAALLEHAQSGRPELQRAADRVASVFAPAVLLVAAGVALAWSLAGAAPLDVAMTAAAVLIVACPCALALATPAAVAAAIGRAASLGILLKSGEALERCARVRHAVLDKTGTVTLGRLELVDVVAEPGVTQDELLANAAAVEGASLHPIARALERAARERGLPLPAIAQRRTRAGLGVEAGARLVGSRALLEEHGAGLSPELLERAEKLAARAHTLAFVARDGRAIGVLALADLPRPDAREAVQALGRLGVEVALVSGDHEQAARRAAELSGIERVTSHASPEDKVKFVARQRGAGGGVLVGGDGINDAAAMVAADVGVAFARGADVAIHAADVVVHSPRLSSIPALVELSRLTLRRIRQNLALAIGYNLLAVPLAALGLLEPLQAAIAMSLSSLVVTGNAVRISRFRPSA